MCSSDLYDPLFVDKVNGIFEVKTKKLNVIIGAAWENDSTSTKLIVTSPSGKVIKESDMIAEDSKPNLTQDNLYPFH